MTTSTTPEPAPRLTPEDFDELDAILDAMRERNPETPQWEFCEGFMAALICCRRLIMPGEYLPVLLGTDDEAQAQAMFADLDQARRFLALWMRRWNEVAVALNNQDVEDLGDQAAYHPEVMDVRGVYASLPEQTRAELADELLPAFAQLWAAGFMDAVENWPEEWAPPRDKQDAEWLNDALDAIAALMDDDEGEPEFSGLADDGPPSISAARMEAFAEAIWAVYDLRELWRALGPRIETVRKEATPGRNDLCYCGSGKKYKKCHGAT